ncbi:MAG: hypothetical protein IJ863_04420, partial [Spirochaetales bacterium]|nr:hypothetical protein [Spirochaetales bacterium]
MRTIVGKGQSLTSWLTSKLFEEPFHAPMVELHTERYRTGITAMRDLYDNYQVSQIKRQFLERGRFFGSPYPTSIAFDGIRLPDGSTMMDFSGFWFYPTEITVYSKLYIESDERKTITLSLRCNGSIIAWANGKEAFRVLSEAVNHDTVKDVKVNLEKGVNEFVVGLNELGERNTMVRFGLCNKTEDKLVTSIPVDIDESALSGIHAFLEGLDMVQENGELQFTFKALELPLEVDISGRKVQLERGQSSFSLEDSFSGHVITALVNFRGTAFSKGFYRFAKQEPMAFIADTEKKRKEAYIDALLKQNKPSPALFIAGLARGMNLYEHCRRPVQNSIEMIRRRGDTSDFRLTEIIWMYCLGKDILPKDLMETFESCMLDYRYWFTEKGNDVMWFFSENHALALHACEYIAGR